MEAGHEQQSSRMSGNSEEAAAAAAAGGPPVDVPATATAAEEFKEKGNAEYRSGRYLKAAALYTQGIKADPSNAVLYRCGKAWAHAEWAAGVGRCHILPVRRGLDTEQCMLPV